MSRRTCSLLTADESVFAHCRELGEHWAVMRLARFADLANLPPGEIIMIDASHPELPAFDAPVWQTWSQHLRLLVLSSAPHDEEGLAALDAGASGYCHVYAAPMTLRNALDVVASGELWVGRALMTRLLRNVSRASRPVPDAWGHTLTEREREVARRAAHGDSNLAIADALGITERTVKAHLSAIFEKLGVADRLQLALRVHGIKA